MVVNLGWLTETVVRHVHEWWAGGEPDRVGGDGLVKTYRTDEQSDVQYNRMGIKFASHPVKSVMFFETEL
jgi:hypothetical protein